MLLFQHSSHHLATKISLDDILQSLRGVAWTDRLAERLDDVYLARFLDLVSRGRDRAEMVALADHLGRVAHDSQRDGLTRDGVSYLDRWRVLREALERRVEALTTPEAVLDAAHVRSLLAALVDGPRPQAELAERSTTRTGTGINKGQLSTLLKRLEAYELIERRPVDGRNQVWLTDLGRRAIGAAAPAPVEDVAATAASARAKRPVLFLSRSAAAR